MNTLVVALMVYSIVTTCYLFGKSDDAPFMHVFLNAIISFVIFLIVMGLIKVFIFFQ